MVAILALGWGCGSAGAPVTGAASGQTTEGKQVEVNAAHLRPPLGPYDRYRERTIVETVSTEGAIDHRNPFFQSLGTNGRSCVTCHSPKDAWTLTPADVQARFDASKGQDPLFRTNDGTVSPLADVSTLAARRAAYRMLLQKAVIRIGIGVPADAEFELVAVDDPYGYASAAELSLFRRPLPATNLKFSSAVMWDGRETFPGQSIRFDLGDQANGATLGHAQATMPLTASEEADIVRFESSLFTAARFDADAGDLTAGKADGGPRFLIDQPFYIGINDPLGQNPEGVPFDPQAFDLYQAWADRGDERDSHDRDFDGHGSVATARAAIARGEALFDSKPIRITGVRGLNDELGETVIVGTCTTCHDTPNVGDHSVAAPLDIGIPDEAFRTPDLPLYTLRNKLTQEIVRVSDPGRALISGKWKDIGKFKGPSLRGLAARPPYFHNGMAPTLHAVVDFYDQRFGIGFTRQERSDLVAFLRAL